MTDHPHRKTSLDWLPRAVKTSAHSQVESSPELECPVAFGGDSNWKALTPKPQTWFAQRRMKVVGWSCEASWGWGPTHASTHAYPGWHYHAWISVPDLGRWGVATVINMPLIFLNSAHKLQLCGIFQKRLFLQTGHTLLQRILGTSIEGLQNLTHIKCIKQKGVQLESLSQLCLPYPMMYFGIFYFYSAFFIRSN